MRCFDIDDVKTWEGPYREVLSDLGVLAAFEEIKRDENLPGPISRLERLAELAMPAGADALGAFRQCVLEFFSASFTHVALFHACRITDRGTYDRDGLRPSDISDLNRIAREVFGPSPQLEAALCAPRRTGYAAHNHGRIGLFFARSGALHIGDHYKCLRHPKVT